jgi:hypothetical protein
MKSTFAEVRNSIDAVIFAAISPGMRRATKYLNDSTVVRATKRVYKGRKQQLGGPIEILLTVGKPNFRERLFIKACKKSGESFPVIKVQWRKI